MEERAAVPTGMQKERRDVVALTLKVFHFSEDFPMAEHPTSNSQHPTPNAASRRDLFDVRRWMFDVRRWMFDVGCSMFDVGCSMFDVRCSTEAWDTV